MNIHERATQILLEFLEAQEMQCRNRDEVFARSMKLSECFRKMDEWAFVYYGEHHNQGEK